jgi:hypothetical protein
MNVEIGAEAALFPEKDFRCSVDSTMAENTWDYAQACCKKLHDYPMINVKGLAAGVLLIPSSIGFVNGQRCRCRVCAFVQPVGC